MCLIKVTQYVVLSTAIVWVKQPVLLTDTVGNLIGMQIAHTAMSAALDRPVPF